MKRSVRALATLVSDDTCRVRVEFYAGKVYFHCKFHRWSVRAMHTLDAAWPKTKRLMGELGFQFVHLFIPIGRPKLQRFCERFGFAEETRNADFIIMKCEV